MSQSAKRPSAKRASASPTRRAAPGHDAVRAPLNVGRAAFVLIKRYGQESADVARQRSQVLAARNDAAAAAEWRLVAAKIDELRSTRWNGPLH